VAFRAAHPALPRWAKLCRASGAGIEERIIGYGSGFWKLKIGEQGLRLEFEIGLGDWI
jgi:hypothetical protein